MTIKRKKSLPPLVYVVPAHPLLLVVRIDPRRGIEYSVRDASLPEADQVDYPLDAEAFDRLTRVAHVDVTDTLARVIHICAGGKDSAEGEEIFSASKSATPAQEN